MIAFIHIKKTAGKTVKYIMRRELGIRHCDIKRWHKRDQCLDAAGLRRVQYVYPGLRSIAGHSVKPYSNLRQADPDIKFYTFLRDPIRRCISQFQYRVDRGRSEYDSFEEWIRNPANQDFQVKALAGESWLDRALHVINHEVAFVGLTEYLNESLALMKPALALQEISVAPARINAAKDNSLRDRLLGDPRCMALLREANQLDLALYEHAKNVIYPRQRERFEHIISPSTGTRSRQPGERRPGMRYYLGGTYRHMVYRPIVWAYRMTSPT